MSGIKILLIAINAKYGHTNLAVRLLREYCSGLPAEISILEFSINNDMDYMLRSIYNSKPDVIGFSCYIWNIGIVTALARSIRKLLAEVFILAGGPEVSYEYDDSLRSGVFDIIIAGEGEDGFRRLVKLFLQAPQAVVRQTIGGAPCHTELDSAPFAYSQSELFDLRDRIVYYESSRGCPFGCAYCLSGSQRDSRANDHHTYSSAGVRFRCISRVIKDLKVFLDAGMRLVKLVDRTFNCNGEFARGIWSYLINNDNGISVFHFEIAADLLNDTDIRLLSTARPGYFQFEAGIQTINPSVLGAVNRKSDIPKLSQNIRRLTQAGNISLHLDLIAGLPGEDMASFRESIEFAYLLRPNKLQLGFLKLIKGSVLRAEAERLGITYRDNAPYEVLRTTSMSYDDLNILKLVSEAIDIFHNSELYRHSIRYLTRNNVWEVFSALAGLLLNAGFGTRALGKAELYGILAAYCGDDLLALCLLKFDILLNERVYSEPIWFPAAMDSEERLRAKKYLSLYRKRQKQNKQDGQPNKESMELHQSDPIESSQNKTLIISKFLFDIPAIISSGYTDVQKLQTYVLFEYGYDKCPTNYSSINI